MRFLLAEDFSKSRISGALSFPEILPERDFSSNKEDHDEKRIDHINQRSSLLREQACMPQMLFLEDPEGRMHSWKE